MVVLCVFALIVLPFLLQLVAASARRGDGEGGGGSGGAVLAVRRL